MSNPINSDFLILGGGLAGSVVASRLAAACPSASIIVLEAGQDESKNPLCALPLASFALHHTSLDWAYATVPQKHLGGRQCYAAAGKALGGSTAVNYGLWTRGAKADYDAWAEMLGGDSQWGYDGMLDYFKRTERHFDKGQSDVHGTHGPIWTTSITLSSPKRRYGLRDSVRNAWTEMGLEQCDDYNAGFPLGFSERIENWRDGKRQLAYDAYGVKDHKNVTILTNQLVKRVVIVTLDDGTKVATGAETADGTIYSASKEVIVTCGAYRSPQVLLLSRHRAIAGAVETWH